MCFHLQMGMTVNESLRLYPPVVNLARQIHQKVVLGNLILPPNVQVAIPILAIHHDPQIWGEDADLFKPERFAQGVAKATNNNMAAFLPFGMGPRNCVGSNFAVIETKIAISMILQHFRFALINHLCSFSSLFSHDESQTRNSSQALGSVKWVS